MTYDEDAVKGDIKYYISLGMNREQIIRSLGEKLNYRNPGISFNRCKEIARKIYDGERTTVDDWKRDSEILVKNNLTKAEEKQLEEETNQLLDQDEQTLFVEVFELKKAIFLMNKKEEK